MHVPAKMVKNKRDLDQVFADETMYYMRPYLEILKKADYRNGATYLDRTPKNDSPNKLFFGCKADALASRCSNTRFNISPTLLIRKASIFMRFDILLRRTITMPALA